MHVLNSAERQKADCCFKNRFINREGIDFSDAESTQAVQVLPCEYFCLPKCQMTMALMQKHL